MSAGQGGDRYPTETVSKVTYVAASNTANRPITLHAWAFRRHGCRLWRWRDPPGCWEEVHDDHIDVCHEEYDSDDPDVVVKVGERADFVSLRPGESWTQTTGHLKPRAGEAQPGDRFKFVFKGTTVDWWDWATKQDQ